MVLLLSCPFFIYFLNYYYSFIAFFAEVLLCTRRHLRTYGAHSFVVFHVFVIGGGGWGVCL